MGEVILVSSYEVLLTYMWYGTHQGVLEKKRKMSLCVCKGAQLFYPCITACLIMEKIP